MKKMKNFISLLLLVTTTLIYSGCASVYVNSKSRKELTTERTETAARDLQLGQVPAPIEEPTIMDGVKNDKVGTGIAAVIDVVVAYFAYDALSSEDSNNGDKNSGNGVSSTQDLRIDISGNENSVSVSSSTSSSESQTQNSQNDNRNF